MNAAPSASGKELRKVWWRRFAATIAALQFAVAGLGGAELTLESRTVLIPENGSVPGLIVRTAQSEISLLPPPRWRLAIDTNATTLTWQTPDYRTMLRLHLVPGQGGVASLNKVALRERVRRDFPDAEIRDEAECFTATHSGILFELQQRNPRFPFATRLAFVPYDGGVLELQLTCPLDDSEQTRHHLTSIMNSLRIQSR